MSSLSPDLSAAVRKVHDFLTVGAPHPLQEGGATALAFDDAYYANLATDYTHRRVFLGIKSGELPTEYTKLSV